MGKIKNGFRCINHFIKNNFFTGLVIIALAWYFWPEGNTPIAYKSFNQVSRSMGIQEESFTEVASLDMDDGISMRKMASSYIQPPVANAQFEPETEDRKIVKNASLQLEVGNTEEAKTLSEAEVTALNGYITNQNSWEVRTGTLAYNMTIRIPSENLENLIENLTNLGIKRGENYSIRDITAQYMDTANQIINLETRRERLRKLMEFETESLSDVLQVDRELTNVQNQIDNLKRTQKGRDIDVAYSTLQLSLNPEPEIGDFNSPDWNLDRSWRQSVNDFIHDARSIVDKLIKVIVYTPIWLPAVLIFMGIKKWRAKRKTQKSKK